MAQLEVWDDRGQTFFRLEGESVVVGRSGDCSLVLSEDGAVSRRHAELVQRAGAVWLISDLGSQNGTLVNGISLVGQHPLKHGDKVTLGEKTWLVFHDDAAKADEVSTFPVNGRPPDLTRTERRVLRELLRPIMKPDKPVPAPATEQEIADRMFVGPGAVRQHLGHLYDKFGIEDTGRRDRRHRLANEVQRRNVIKPSDYEDEDV